MTQADPLLTTGDVARALDVTDETIRRWIRAGRIKAIQYPSGQIRIRQSTIDEILTTPFEPEAEDAEVTGDRPTDNRPPNRPKAEYRHA